MIFYNFELDFYIKVEKNIMWCIWSGVLFSWVKFFAPPKHIAGLHMNHLYHYLNEAEEGIGELLENF